jgi:hypothetical protein
MYPRITWELEHTLRTTDVDWRGDIAAVESPSEEHNIMVQILFILALF